MQSLDLVQISSLLLIQDLGCSGDSACNWTSLFYFKYWFDRCNTERQSSHLLLHFTNACNSQGWDRPKLGTWTQSSTPTWLAKTPAYEPSLLPLRNCISRKLQSVNKGRHQTQVMWDAGRHLGCNAKMPAPSNWVPTTHREDLDCILNAHFSPWPKTTLCGLLGSKPTHKYSHLSVAQVSKIVTKHISFYVHHHGAIVFKA